MSFLTSSSTLADIQLYREAKLFVFSRPILALNNLDSNSKAPSDVVTTTSPVSLFVTPSVWLNEWFLASNMLSISCVRCNPFISGSSSGA